MKFSNLYLLPKTKTADNQLFTVTGLVETGFLSAINGTLPYHPRTIASTLPAHLAHLN